MNVLVLLLSAAAAWSGSVLHVRASAPFGPCLAPVVTGYARDAGGAAVLDIGRPYPPGNADVVIGDDAEMTRLLEGGGAVFATAVDLGSMPFVHVGPTSSSSAATRPVPRSLAGPGDHRPADVRPLIATAAEITGAPNAARARAFLAYLGRPPVRAIVDGCFGGGKRDSVTASPGDSAAVYARAVVDWWIPDCSLTQNRHNDTQESLGPPNAVRLEPDVYRGLVSLGQGGYVTLELGEPAVDRNGSDIRVFQTTTGEPVTLYASAAAGGPFLLLGLRRFCGTRTPGVFSNHCDFDLRDAGLGTARYVKVEDGEIYPCLAAGTRTEGADIDAVQVLNR